MDEWNKKLLKILTLSLAPIWLILSICVLMEEFASQLVLPSLIIGETLWIMLVLVIYKKKGKEYFEV